MEPKDSSPTESQQIFVRFSNLKAVFFVRDFEGKFDKKQLQAEWHPEGHEITVKFKDGEVIEGYALTAYDENAERFHLIPKKPGNNVSVLVERGSVAQLALGGALEQETYVAESEQAAGQPQARVSTEETLGDFYFYTKNYFTALTEYDKAFKQDPGNPRLRRKVAVSTFNVGVHYIKVKDYKRALQYFEEVLRHEPKNKDARKKIQKLRRIVSTETKEEAKV
jgi:tetratricopeptide (TPR) repeat protein